jgi:hypothetical protein
LFQKKIWKLAQSDGIQLLANNVHGNYVD